MTTPKNPAVLAGIETAQKLLSEQGIGKARENTAQKFMFRGIDDVLNALSTALVAGRLAVTPNILHLDVNHFSIEKERGGSKYLQTTYICELQMEYHVRSLVDGSEIIVSIPSMSFDQSDKAVNKALANAYKYMAFQTFCIPVDGLPDQDSDHIVVDGKTPTQVPELPIRPADEVDAEMKAQIDQLEDGIRGAPTLEDLEKAFKVAFTYARNRKRADLQESFTKLKDLRKQLLIDAADAGKAAAAEAAAEGEA